MSITPFHFACHVEERLRAQFEILDPALGAFVMLFRRFSLTEGRAQLYIGKKVSNPDDFVAHVTLGIMLVNQKEVKTALNCTLDCPTNQAHKSFRLLLNNPDEAETQILKMLDFLQKAFLPMGYAEGKEAPHHSPAATASPIPSFDQSAEMNEQSIATATAMVGTLPTRAPTMVPVSTETTAPMVDGKKYIMDNTKPGETVRMKTADGKYVPEGELPATLRIIKK